MRSDDRPVGNIEEEDSARGSLGSNSGLSIAHPTRGTIVQHVSTQQGKTRGWYLLPAPFRYPSIRRVDSCRFRIDYLARRTVAGMEELFVVAQ
jgi:hypothetical protein